MSALVAFLRKLLAPRDGAEKSFQTGGFVIAAYDGMVICIDANQTNGDAKKGAEKL